MPTNENNKQLAIGWREWAALPLLGIPAIKIKVDTGAKTSALHTYKMETFNRSGMDYIRFWIHPLQRRKDIEIACEAQVLDRRVVRDSGGHAEERYVISTPIRIGPHEWEIELTLTSREDMLFRMLLGRRAIVGGDFLVDPKASYLHGKRPRKAYPSRKKKHKGISK
ncbi:MAG: RimK/LysX family protein [Gammaproteobacteria bacterium]